MSEVKIFIFAISITCISVMLMVRMMKFYC